MNNDSLSDDIRPGCIDIWNAFMVKNAQFVLGSDMPICPCTAKSTPNKLISYVEAKHIHTKMSKENKNYHIDAYVHFYIDDQKFDGRKSSIWSYPDKALEILRHYSGIISPDFSTFSDFPDALKRYNTYRSRAFGYWISSEGIPVINNVRWGTEETWDYCFDGIPYNSMVAIGTVASKLRLLKYRPTFKAGLNELVRVLHPHTIIVYGSSNYSFFDELKNQGIIIASYASDTNLAFSTKKGGVKHE
ncbi:MAG: DUF4417 domain-containing protein [Lachnospiraceae bacterium]|nr:DUF4417 domain-containing protein [Lachnospiraceae bacterium]